MLTEAATATAVELESIVERSFAAMVMSPPEISTARSACASITLAIRLSASETPRATEAPTVPNEKATETAITLESIEEMSSARITIAPSTSMPLPLLAAMKARVSEAIRLVALAPAPPSATPTVAPPAMATDPAKTVDRIACSLCAVSARSSV